MKNAYPELPVLAFARTSVPMPDVIAALQKLDAPAEVKRMAYIMFRNESGNGKSGVNHNYCGAQADGNRWPDHLTPLFAGTVIKEENQTGKERIFIAFRDVSGSLAFLIDRVASRGLFIGGTTSHVVTMSPATPTDLCRAYHKEWVQGAASAEPAAADLAGFLSMYRQAEGFFA